MDRKEWLKLDYLPHFLANTLYEHGRLLQEDAREGRSPARLKLDRAACFEVAKRQYAMLLEQVGIIEIWCRARPTHSWPPRDPSASEP
jgi:hypothetical protein